LVYPPIIVKNNMKVFMATALLILFIGNIWAVDTESYQFIDYLRAITTARAPEIYADGVLFTAPSSYKRVGISFAHEGFSRVHWFKKLMVPKDSAELLVKGKIQKNIDPLEDSGLLFHFEIIPVNIANMDYRMIIDGLWTTDPLNPRTYLGASGIVESRVPLPPKPETSAEKTPPGTYRFSFLAAPGETITVGGSFNNWDPFMYELREESPGFYTLLLPLPPGSFQYVFFYRGEWIADTANAKCLYSPDGRIVSEGVVARPPSP
jgi:hypothetical protein